MNEKRRSPLAGIVLAAGMSRRFGSENKLLAVVDGVPVVRRTVLAYTLAGLHPVVVVTGHQDEAVRDALAGLPLVFVHNDRFAQGQSTSLRRGLQALPPSAVAAVIGVGDQPYLTTEVVQALVDAYVTGETLLVAPRYAGQRGNPVVFDRSVFAELAAVTGDTGGRDVLKRREHEIRWIDYSNARPGADVDRPADLEG